MASRMLHDTRKYCKMYLTNHGVHFMEFAEKFLKLRKSAGLSQQEAAKKLGVSRQAVSRWERGTALPDSLNILGICTVFGVSADYLVNDDVCASGQSADNRRNDAEGRKNLHAVALCIGFHLPSLIVEAVSLLIFVGGNYTLFWILFAFGVLLSLAGIVTAEVIFHSLARDLRLSAERKYYRTGVWLFLPVLLLVLVEGVAYAAMVCSHGYGSSTMPAFLLAFLAFAVYVFIGIVVCAALSSKK